LNPSKSTFGKPFDSTQGFTAKEQLVLSLIILAFGFYIGFKVWRGLRNERMNKK
jgi:predicted negative regulator of RcsB-dependent stress response